ncbi:MAG: hypothetical protein U0Q12_28385, partial [Vicinamibacterales bacterium]
RVHRQPAGRTIATQVRPKAHQAFADRDYALAARLFELILPSLSASERCKFEIAKSRSSPHS